MKLRLISILGILQLAQVGGKEKIHILHISNFAFYDYDLAASVDFAVELLNNQTDLLPDHNVVVHHITGKATYQEDVGFVVKGFIDQVSTPPAKVMLLGPTFSRQAQVIAEVTKQYSMVQMGYSNTAPSLSDSERFPLFTRVIESTIQHNPAMTHLLELFNWTRVAKLSSASDFVLANSADLQRRLDSMNVSTLASTTYSTDPRNQVQQIKDSGAQIIFLYTTVSGFSLFCKIYQLGMYGPYYQYLHWSGRHGMFEQDLQRDGPGEDNCTPDMVKEALEGVIFFNPASVASSSRDQPGPAGMTPPETMEAYRGFLTRNNRSELFPHGIDAVWSAGLALHDIVATPDGATALKNFDYLDKEFGERLKESISNVEFLGVTGAIAFESNGDRATEIVVGQIQDGKEVQVALFDHKKSSLSLLENQRFKFPGGKPPLDYVAETSEEIVISKDMFVVMSVISAVGIIGCVLSFVFNTYYHNLKLVKLSSPRVNSIILLGCCLSFVSVILLGIDSVLSTKPNWICQVRSWTLMYGFTLTFGSMFSKTWRVHFLFTRSKLQKKAVKDIHLLGLVSVVFLLDTILLLSWSIFDPMSLIVVRLGPEFDVRSPGVLIHREILRCTSTYISYWTGVIYAFKALLLLFGIFFAFETRKVQIQALNDSKQMGICIYNTMVMTLICVPLTNFMADHQVSVTYAIIAASILVCIYTNLILVFALKMVTVWTGSHKVDELTALPFAASLRNKSRGTGERTTGSDVPLSQRTPVTAIQNGTSDN